MARAATAPDLPLTEKQLAFIERFLVHFNGSQAVIEAGYSKSRARQTANDLLANPAVQYHLAQRRAEVREEIRQQAKFDRETLLEELWHTALGDDTEITQVHRVCCRYCHGEAHSRQYTPAEWAAAKRDHEEACHEAKQNGMPIPKPMGKPGAWFNGTLAPNPACPECFGRGHEVMYLADTRTLSPSARRLYAGVKMTKEGIEVKTRSKEAAQDKLMRHLGLYEADNRQGADALAQSVRDLMGAAGALRPAASGAHHDDQDDDD